MRTVDVLVIAALPEEFEAAKAVPGFSPWAAHGTGGTTPYVTATYDTGTGQQLAVALARPTRMGGRGTGALTTALTGELRPACLAMCGVCAGNPGTTAPGDVVVAAPAYEWDEGKHTGAGFRGDHQQFPQDTRWLRAAQDFDPAGLSSHGPAGEREAELWFLERLFKRQNPRTHPARRRYFPPLTWESRLERWRSGGLIDWAGDRWALTAAGLDRIRRIVHDDVDGPERLPFQVAAGPMASGSAVVADPAIWDLLGASQRTVLAVEMEAATIATVAHEQQVPHWLVAKGVMDHAGPDKDDRFKSFAARASAEVLLALLGRLLRPAVTPPRSTPARRAVPADVKHEVVRRLAYDWQDLADVVGVPSSEMRRFRPGDEARELWSWVAGRDRLAELPGALTEIGRTDLATVLRAYLG